MKESLQAGIETVFRFTVHEGKTVPALYPESDIFQSMPPVLATGYFVGLLEWACLEVLRPHMEAGEGSLGVFVNVSHIAATPPGMTVEVHAKVISVAGQRVMFEVKARDEVDVIGEGTHERFVVHWDRFAERVEKKRRAAAAR